MNTIPIDGSNITTQFTDGYQTIIIPHKKASAVRYLIGAFLLAWLGGWTAGFFSALTSLLSSIDMFLLFWLAAWTLGGAYACYMLYRLFRKPIPEQLHLNVPNLIFDTGVPPLDIKFGTRYSRDYWKSLFHRRKQIVFTPVELQSLRLRETDSGNRLTIDQGTDRIDIATGATEIEREWIYSTLKGLYL